MNFPVSVQSLDRIPNDEYNYKRTVVQRATVPPPIVIWNLIDFAHVNWVHRKTYNHCKILAQRGNVHLLEYGVKQFFFLKLNFSLKYLMWHEYVRPNIVRHISRSPWGSYSRVEVVVNEIKVGNETHSEIHHTFYMNAPKFLHRFVDYYIDKWSDILWEEDGSMLMRRKKILETGFRDHPVDANVRAVEGFLHA